MNRVAKIPRGAFGVVVVCFVACAAAPGDERASPPSKASLVTVVAPLEAFYPAEAYHQHYYRRNPNQGYCRVVIAPKVAKFREQFMEKLNR